MRKKRIYGSVLGIPIWVITGMSLFILFSAVYDFFVLDRSIIRYGLIGASAVILITTVVIHVISLRAVSNQARRQLGG